MISFEYRDLANCDLFVDAVYRGGPTTSLEYDPLHRLLGVGTSGGFRYIGSTSTPTYVVLFSSGADLDWPDYFDLERGLFYYYGDNKKPGRELHDTKRRGNLILRNVFERIHAEKPDRRTVPPFLVFSSAQQQRDVRFRGLAVPGSDQLTQTEDLVAIWRSIRGERFQNYRSTFSILDAPHLKREWLKSLTSGVPDHSLAPEAWRKWLTSGVRRVLKAEPTIRARSKIEQLPSTSKEASMLEQIYGRFAEDSVGFEYCAAELVKMIEPRVASLDITRPSRDGGRDAVGSCYLGLPGNHIEIEFSMEAKCYKPGTPVGVREVARLISRLRHRQFGILITTSYLHKQAYEEIIADRHPIIVVSGADIVRLLIASSFESTSSLDRWLTEVQKLRPSHVASLVGKSPKVSP